MALVCHMEKYKASDCGGLQTEDNRESNAINSKNPLLDTSKTYLNKHYSYDTGSGNIIECERSTLVDIIKYHKNRINVLKEWEGKPKLRKDAVVCCSFIVGADPEFMKNLSYKEQQEYFKCAVDYFEGRGYTVIEYSMHFDEGTPHMHARILPELEAGRLSAKEMFTPMELSRIQRELPKWLNEHDFAIEAGKEGAKKEHLNEMDFRIKKSEEKLNALESEFAEMNADLDKVEKLLSLKNAELREIEEKEQKGLEILENLKKLEYEANTRLKEINNQGIQADKYFRHLWEMCNEIESGLDACQKVNGLVETIENLADVLRDEHTKMVAQTVKEKYVPLEERIKRAGEVIEKHANSKTHAKNGRERYRDR